MEIQKIQRFLQKMVNWRDGYETRTTSVTEFPVTITNSRNLSQSYPSQTP